MSSPASPGSAARSTSFTSISVSGSRPGLPAGVKGDEWQVHGGGFYHMIKYLVAPSQLPDHLTWFKWEAYATWLSGFALLGFVYYLGADLFLIDKSVLDMTVAQSGRRCLRQPGRFLADL